MNVSLNEAAQIHARKVHLTDLSGLITKLLLADMGPDWEAKYGVSVDLTPGDVMQHAKKQAASANDSRKKTPAAQRPQPSDKA